ncbi:uncharacterized protein [Clytia hemisphaerica]|uniref:Uncharacterized protein n=1 Tax=Clytia hemisphaerica TaxID=252671 RepID=A0A7M5V9V6_9CNID
MGVGKREWGGRHQSSLLFVVVFMCTIVLYEVMIEINLFDNTPNRVLLVSPKFLHRRNQSLFFNNIIIEKKKPIFEEINHFIKLISKSKRFERKNELRKEMLDLVRSLNRLSPGHTPKNNIGQNVTLILNGIQDLDNTLALLSDLKQHLPDWSKKTRILVALNNKTNGKLSVYLKQLKPILEWVTLTEEQSKLIVSTLVNAIQKVTTPYVFLVRGARKFDNILNWDQFLKPLLRGYVDVVSGAVRYPNGNWHSGCHQSKLIWSQYKTQHGYDMIRHNDGRKSQNKLWVQCDYFDGPFAIKIDILLAALSPKIRKICPDPMFYKHVIYTLNNLNAIMSVSQTTTFYMDSPKELTRRQWLDFAFISEISEIIAINTDHSITHYEFNYTEVNCVCSNKANMLKPRACMRNLHFMLMNTYKLFDKYNYGYTNEDGSGMSATKLDDTLPWDLDQDFAFRSSDFADLVKHEDEFQKVGMYFAKELEGKTCLTNITDTEDFACGYIGLRGRNWRLEVWGEYLLLGDLYQPWKLNPLYQHLLPSNRIHGNDTKVRMRDHWSQMRPNPGQYSRLRYGCDILHHAKHWSEGGGTNKKSSWGNYITGPRFQQCAIEGHHLCLNQYLADGNIQFQQPWA